MFFRCECRHCGFPITTKGVTYVACLDCGQEWSYSWEEMRRGQRIAPLVTHQPVQEDSERSTFHGSTGFDTVKGLEGDTNLLSSLLQSQSFKNSPIVE